MLSPFPKRQILDSSNQKEFTDCNSKFDKNGRKFSKWVENTSGNGKIACYEQCSHNVLKRLVLQTHKNLGLFGKGLKFFKKNLTHSHT